MFEIEDINQHFEDVLVDLWLQVKYEYFFVHDCADNFYYSEFVNVYSVSDCNVHYNRLVRADL